MRRSPIYITPSDKILRGVYSGVSVTMTVYAVLMASEFLYNGIRFTKGLKMAAFVLPILPVFIGGFVFAFVGPMLIRKLSANTNFHKKTIQLIGWQSLACGGIGFTRIVVLNAIFGTGFNATVGLLGIWFFYTTIILSIAGITGLIVGFAMHRN